LAKLAGPAAAPFVKAFAESKGAASKKADAEKKKSDDNEEHVIVTIDGKRGSLSKLEFEDLRKQMREALRGALRAAQQQAVTARGLWDHFNELNTDQYIVGWCIQLVGPDLPDVTLIVDAEAAVKRLESALNGTDFDKIAAALADVAPPVNTAAKAMWTYQKAVIGHAENWVVGLEFTRDVSFEVVKAIAKFETGGKGAPLIDAAAEAVKRTATEVGKYSAGTSGGVVSAVKNVAVDAVVAGGVGLLLKDGGRGKALIESAVKKVAPLIAKGWLAGASRVAVEKFLTNWLQKSGEKALDAAFKEAAKVITGDTRPEEFTDKLAKSLANAFALGGLDVWIDSKFAQSAYEVLKTTPALAKLFDVEKDVAIALLKREFLAGSGSKLIEKSIDATLNAATGNESTEQIGKRTVESVVKSPEFRRIAETISKRIKK
jgi:hypothetical protein